MDDSMDCVFQKEKCGFVENEYAARLRLGAIVTDSAQIVGPLSGDGCRSQPRLAALSTPSGMVDFYRVPQRCAPPSVSGSDVPHPVGRRGAARNLGKIRVMSISRAIDCAVRASSNTAL
jgi:hypothetical protein